MRTQETTGVVFVADDERGRAQRFREAALPHLGDVYTLARYLLRNPADAEDAAQECYLRAFRHFHTFRGGPIKPWLLAILRNVCRAEYARRGALAAVQVVGVEHAADDVA
jgi:RNA polymerase sigma-70 factor (ECF subfamily)